MTTAPETTELVLVDRHDGVLTMTINRAAQKNAVNREVAEQLGAALDLLDDDAELSAGVLTGAGGTFSAGMDLKAFVAGELPMLPGRGLGGLTRARVNKPLIAAVEGWALGGGFELALACDLVIASDRSQFGLPEARLGLMAGAGGVFRLTRQAPYRVAMGYLMTGRRMSAQRAYELGLVNEVAPADRLDRCVADWVADVLSSAPLAVRAMKEVAAKALTMPLPEAFAGDYEWERRRMLSADAVEGPRAFAEKRAPRWLGA
jgi:crotonobetainyl-CoA hydratase/dehydration protein DpgD